MRTRFQRSKQPAGWGTAEVCCRPADPMAIGRARLRSAAPGRNRSQFSVAGWLLGARGKGIGAAGEKCWLRGWPPLEPRALPNPRIFRKTVSFWTGPDVVSR